MISTAAVLAVFAGICSVLETVGGALLAHRTKNPYVHLAFGCLLFVVAGAIPRLVVVLTAIGSLSATRGGPDAGEAAPRHAGRLIGMAGTTRSYFCFPFRTQRYTVSR